MQLLFIVDNPARWPINVADVQVVSSRTYLADPAYHRLRHARVFNLCRSYSYQSLGYYVSLLAEARGHRPQPDLITTQDMKFTSLARVITDDFDELIQKSLRSIRTDSFTLSIYFGKTLAKRDRQLGLRIFNAFRCPLLRADFIRRKHKWQVQSIGPIPAKEIPESHQPDVIQAANEYFAKRRKGVPIRAARYDMAILVDPQEAQPPSDAGFLDRFRRVAKAHGMSTELITRDDYGFIAEFDALFIRTTTAVNHYTYRFARRADAEGLAVIDDPVSIVRCANKVFLAERLRLQGVNMPRTMVLHRDNMTQAIAALGLPMVLKQPDSAFSVGVKKVETAEQFQAVTDSLLEDSDLIVAQAYLPTAFDWRVGILDGKPLYACRYFMARRHWQIQRRDAAGRLHEGAVETLAVEDAPPRVIRTALKAAKLIGDGLYGVDLKAIGNKVYVIEVNDNPSIESGCEDTVLKDQLYERLVQSFIRRIDAINAAAARAPANGEAGPV